MSCTITESQSTASLNAAGPFREADGTSYPPEYIQTYVLAAPLTLGIILPAVAFIFLLWQHAFSLATCTLGVYLLEVMAQLKAEGFYLKQSKTCSCRVHCATTHDKCHPICAAQTRLVI